MAEFVSTTVPSAYSDASRAFSIKALEKRLADAQAANASATVPDLIPTPIQGIGHVVNQLAGGMNEARLEQKAAASKAELAKLIAGYNPDGPNAMATVGQIGVHNPELAATLMQNFHDARQNKAREDAAMARTKAQEDAATGRTNITEGGVNARHGQTLQAQKDAAAARVEAEKAAAAEAARVADEAQRGKETRAEEREKTKFQGPVGEQLHNLDVLLGQGKITPDDHKAQRDAILSKASTPKIDEGAIKARGDAEKAYAQSQIAVDDLKRARDAFAHPGGTYTGAMQNIAPGASTIPGSDYFIDKDKAQRTALVNNVLSKIATGTMAQTLKGSSTNFEMQKFEKIFNDPAVSPRDKQIAFDNLIRVAEADLGTDAAQVKALGGNTGRINETMAKPAAGAAGGGSSEDDEARAWLADPKNASHPAREGVMKRLEGK